MRVNPSIRLLRFHLVLFKWFGVVPAEDASSLYRIWSVISCVVIGIGLPASQFMTLIYAASGADVIKIPVLLCTTASISLKCVFIYANRTTLKRLIEVMHELDHHVDSKTEAFLLAGDRKSFRLRKAFSSGYWGALSVLFLELFLFGNEKSFWRSTIGWPYGWSHHPVAYYTIFLLQMLTNTVNCSLAGATDTLGTICNIIGTSHLNALSDKLKRLRDQAGDATEDRNELIEVIKYHNSTLEYVRLLERLLSPMLLLQFSTSIPVLCTCAYQLSQAHMLSSMELAFILFYMPAMLLQLSVPCYFGSAIIFEGNSLSVDIFASNWIAADLPYKKLFWMTMVKLTASYAIVAGHLIPLNLNTFIVVIKTTYSFYAVLKNTQT